MTHNSVTTLSLFCNYLAFSFSSPHLIPSPSPPFPFCQDQNNPPCPRITFCLDTLIIDRFRTLEKSTIFSSFSITPSRYSHISQLYHSLIMAHQQVSRPALVRLAQCPGSPAISPSSLHKNAFAPALKDIPAAADAMRHIRSTKPTPPRTVFILDWDDTCCATSFLERCGLMNDFDANVESWMPQIDRYLRVLEHRVLTLLKTSLQLGTVLIVTNAGEGWVEISAERFLPAVKAFLDANKKQIKVISARARYVETHRHIPLQWKVLTFSDELKEILASAPFQPYDLNVIVLGDSVGDQYAAHVTSNSLAAMGMPVIMKVVKFLERPTIDQLCKELAVLLDHLSVMTCHRGPFDVSMYKEPSPTYSQPPPKPATISPVSDSSTAPSSDASSSQSSVPSVAECAAVV